MYFSNFVTLLKNLNMGKSKLSRKPIYIKRKINQIFCQSTKIKVNLCTDLIRNKLPESAMIELYQKYPEFKQKCMEKFFTSKNLFELVHQNPELFENYVSKEFSTVFDPIVEEESKKYLLKRTEQWAKRNMLKFLFFSNTISLSSECSAGFCYFQSFQVHSIEDKKWKICDGSILPPYSICGIGDFKYFCKNHQHKLIRNHSTNIRLGYSNKFIPLNLNKFQFSVTAKDIAIWDLSQTGKNLKTIFEMKFISS